MSVIQGPVLLLRALSKAIGDDQFDRMASRAEGDAQPTPEEAIARVVLCDLATACHRAAADLEANYKTQLEEFTK